MSDPMNEPPASVPGAAMICTHRPPCSGCPRFGEPGIAPGTLALLDQLAATHNIPRASVVSGPSSGFRLRSRMAIRGRVGSPKIGLFEGGTHRVVHVPHCQVHHPLINRVAAVVRRALVETQTTCYSDKAHLGIARHLQVVIERSSERAQVVLVGNCEDATPLAPCLDLIRTRLGDELHSLWFNSNTTQSNVILGANFQRWCGPPTVIERFGGPAVHYPPGAFGQSNLAIGERIIGRVRELIPPGAVVVEFFAGVGAIGLSVLERAGRLIMNEINPASLQGMALGVEGLPANQRGKVTVVPGAADDTLAAASGAQVVIVDPPRKGLEARTAEHLAQLAPPRLIYVSCGIDSLAADSARITAGGRMRLVELAAFNLLPFTEHVETVAVFDAA